MARDITLASSLHLIPVSGDDDERNAREEARVLLVDDDVVLGSSFSRILKEGSFAVVVAGSGAEAEKALSDSDFDVVISDVQMPTMNGIELLRTVREQDPDLAVLLISGSPDVATAIEAVRLGATEYLTKPIEPSALLASARRASEITREKRRERAALERVKLRGHDAPSSRPSHGSWTGVLLAGRYRIGKRIGAGGMGTVYEATREDLGGMAVAIKIVHEFLAREPAVLVRFRREAESIARLNHPNIVRVHDYESQEDGPTFLVMERLEGTTLAWLIERRAPLGPERTVFIVSQILSALTAAHSAGVIHRDLKPGNVFLTTVSGMEDIVRVLDFGVAKLVDDETGRLTREGALIGTPAYMSPEQARGESVDARSDLYAVGALMYECLTGLPPLRARSYHALLSQLQEQEPDPLGALRPELDPALVAVVSRALKKVADDRFQSAAEMRDALSPWMPPLPTHTGEDEDARTGETRDARHFEKTTLKEEDGDI